MKQVLVGKSDFKVTVAKKIMESWKNSISNFSEQAKALCLENLGLDHK
jgi:hypothetical protein